MVRIVAGSPTGSEWRQLVPLSVQAQVAARLKAAADPPICFVASLFGGPVGCAICLPDRGRGELLLLTTTPKLRRRGIATNLLEAIEREGIVRGLRGLETTWSDDPDDAGIAGAFLMARGWSAPHRSGIAMSLAARPGSDFLGGLAQRLPPCPFVFAPWASLTDEQRRGLRDGLLRYEAMPPGLDPFRLEDMADPSISYALIDGDGRVVGWHLSYWAAPDRAWVLASFGFPEALGGACFFRLWQRFFQDVALVEPEARCAWDTHVSLEPMMRFLLRRRNSAQPETHGRWSAMKILPAA